MPSGCCGEDTCSCLIVSGNGVAVSGSGTITDPYVVTLDNPNFSESFQVRDTDSVNLSLFGSGVPSDPFILEGDVQLPLVDLSDIHDPEGGPAVGEVPTWVFGGFVPGGHWEFKTPPPAPAGSVNVNNGITGTGAGASPIGILTSGVWGVGSLAGLGSDSTIGLPTYIDSAGQLRAAPSGSGVSWTSITGKPSTFPPSPHMHPASDITDPLDLDVGQINGTPIFVTQTEDLTWANGTVWGSY